MRRPRLCASVRGSVALLAAWGLLLAGCDRGKLAPKAPDGATGSAGAASAAPTAPSDAITWETAGNPLKMLKIGDSATYTVAGLTVTIRVNSFQPVSDYPKVLDEDGSSCGSWWLATLTTTFSAKNLRWKDWTLTPVSSLGAQYGDPKINDSTNPDYGYTTQFVSTHEHDVEPSASLKVKTDRLGQTDFAPVTFDSKAYFPNCDHHVSDEGKYRVSTKPPVGLDWNVWAPRDLDPKNRGKDAVLWRL